MTGICLSIVYAIKKPHPSNATSNLFGRGQNLKPVSIAQDSFSKYTQDGTDSHTEFAPLLGKENLRL